MTKMRFKKNTTLLWKEKSNNKTLQTMIIRVIIHIDTVRRDDLDRSERIYFHSCKIYNDEKSAVEGTDKELENFNLNDGCSLSSSEDFISLNGKLAERFDDCYNQDAYATWDDIEEELINQCNERFCEHHWELGLLLKIAEELDIDINGI